MTKLTATGFLALAGFGLLATQVSAQTFCYTDENDIYTCTDNVPPEDARFDRTIINDQGVVIDTEEGEITDEERAAMDAEELRIQEAETIRLAQQQYDQVLLDSYLSVEAIERVRDRNLEVYQSQARVMEIYLTNLKKKLGDLLRDAERFAPYNREPDAPQIPGNLADDIANTETSIDVREQMLEEIQNNQQEIQDKFDRDIERFKYLMGLAASGVAESSGSALTLSELADDR